MVTALTKAAWSIAFNPIFWNIIAQSQYRSNFLLKLAGGDPYRGCYGLAVTIFSIGLIRDHLFLEALKASSSSPWLLGLPHKAIGAILLAVGNTLVLSSMWALGVTGTYLGDYFGILMEKRVTSFPFNV